MDRRIFMPSVRYAQLDGEPSARQAASSFAVAGLAPRSRYPFQLLPSGDDQWVLTLRWVT
ncbi:hypothetical protein [Nonomuraea sp. NPDC005692]|uniref:hypothetical protein n=1 Tax=Nonomuraea sp. NPDC005692 TaxID=3157168 RepID=UPI0033FA9B98